jgi:hypothetical protein
VNIKTDDPRALLLRNVSQYEVDFVIPRIGVDVPVGIDPFLLYKSRNPEYRKLHEILLGAFNAGIDAVELGAIADARQILDFPEVSAIGMGYTRNSKQGSGVGTHLTNLIVETLLGSPSLRESGVRHVEEMQLLSAGIGPDRISDIAGNILKRFLIEYTQRQCALWNIALTPGVPVSHIYNPTTQCWDDSYEDLPVSSINGSPTLLVPRRLVRALPWINYDDFMRTEFSAYLKTRRESARRSRAHVAAVDGPVPQEPRTKTDVVTVTRGDLSLVQRYVRSREQQSAGAQPAFDYIDEDACREAEVLKRKLAAIRPGRERAAEYQQLVLEVLNYLFNPELIDGEPEVRTVDGTERRDIIFTNDSDESFWDYVRAEHGGILVMFEAKNTDDLELANVNQTATYLGDRIGRLGIIVTRRSTPKTIQRKMFSVWNDSAPNRKVILTLDDEQICELLDLRCRNGSPTKWMQKHYRAFRTAVQ